MSQYLPIILLSAALAFVVTPGTRWLAARWGAVAQPGVRRVHRSPVPLLGGIALYLGVTLAFVAFGQRDWMTEGIGILGGATLMFLTGLWDDRFGLSPRVKLGANLVAGLFLIGFGVQVRLFDVGPLDWMITLVWVVGITNAVNLMDNMDGLAAGITATGAAVFFGLAAAQGQGLVASLAAALFGSAMGFLFYNFAPAVSFMGDAGALPLGFLLAALAIQLEFRTLPLASTWMAPILVLGVLIFDTTLVTVSRLRRGLPVSQGGSDHTSHRLVQLGLSRPRAVLTLYVAALALGALAFLTITLPPLQANLVFAAALAFGLAGLFWLERVEPALAGDPAVVWVPGAGPEALKALPVLRALSHDLTILLADPRLSASALGRVDVAALLAGLGDAPEATGLIVSRALSDDWPTELDWLQAALRLQGHVVVANPDSAGDVAAALRRARVVVFGPGEPASCLAMWAADGLQGTLSENRRAVVVWAGPPIADAPGFPIALANLDTEIHQRLLGLAAKDSKTRE